MKLTEAQEYELLAAISARGEIPDKFTYLGEGAARWDKEYRAKVVDEEKPLMAAHIKSFLRAYEDTRGVNLIDLGCGNGLPAIGVIKKLQEEDLFVNYVAVDLSQKMLALALKNVKKALPNLSVSSLWADFENESLTSPLLDIKRKSKLPNLLINIGGTLGNHSNASGVLTNFLQSMTLEDYLIIGNGLVNDQNPQKILSAYDGSEMVKESVTAPARELGIFNDKDDYRVLWNATEHRIEARIKLNGEKLLALAGQSVPLEKGDEILVLKSRKYTESSLTKLLSNVGFRTELLTTNRNRSYILAMIQPTRYSAS